jgi:hypothetical protein
MIAWQDQKRKLHFRVSDTGSWRSQGSNSQEELAKCETPKSRNRHINKDSISGVSDTGSWRSQESRLFITGVPKLRNVKRRNPEIGTSTKTHFRVSIPGVGGVKSRDSSSQGVPKSPKCEMRKTPFEGFGYRELECQNTSSQGMSKCRNAHLLV